MPKKAFPFNVLVQILLGQKWHNKVNNKYFFFLSDYAKTLLILCGHGGKYCLDDAHVEFVIVNLTRDINF